MAARTRFLVARLAGVLALLLSAVGCTPTAPAADGAAAPGGDVDGRVGGDAASVTEPDVPPLSDDVDELDEVVVLVRDGDREVAIEAKVAATDHARRRGLMDVPVLPDGAGMLFVFPRERTGGFWMKDTLVPLDVAFADDDGEVLEILSMDPCASDPCPVHDPDVRYRYALEVPRGWFAVNGVREGDELQIGEIAPPVRAGSEQETTRRRQ